ncbi:metal-dependent hydrolase [Kribbella sp. ALI-6-A]|uniref:endonuclease/exonuclease/phosphatase family protein n=1 Tax=Kribbella sp. ALI-6-A TaxID=1933817 RepID=UPI00097CA10C|nr:endonuclease/exonuclease/phosphatase family protein [Kribbella sp. ALI-6-A]ONI68763.1 metal-dependent hydrolase [Kribbella sp. ALI-6-A]
MVKRFLVLVAALTLLAGVTPAVADGNAPAVPLRVATYNIHAGAGHDNVFDLDRTETTLRALDADVIGLQEVDVHWSDRSQWRDLVSELAGRLGMRAGFAPIYDFDPLRPGEPRRQYGLAVLSKAPILDVHNHDLTRLSTQDPDAGPMPMPGFLEAVIQAKGARLHFYVTHLDYRADPSLRRTEVDETLKILAADPAGANQVLVGDFNAEPQAPELARLWPTLTDAWTAAPVTTGNPLTYPAATPVKRIDYITVSDGVGVLRAEVPASPALLAASDHRPVVADLTLARGSEVHS